MAIVTLLYLVYLLLPIALLLIGSVGEVWSNTLLPSGLTGRWYLDVVGDVSFRRAFESSLAVAGATVAISLAVGAPLAYAIAVAAHRGVTLAARIVYLLPIAAPPIVLAFGMMLVFSSDTLPYLGSTGVLIGGHIVLCLPYLLQALVADLRHLGIAELERAAESLGASFGQRFFDIVLPTLRHSLATGAITVAALSIGEFQVSNLIAGFTNRTYPVVLLQAFYGATGFACAATVILLALALAAAVGGALTAHGTSAAGGATS
ncbi:ABC transporter permease [Blastochloris viridis]|uniref:Spermidine/putrescine ABC transporter membrane protein n=1 Tax=Blastochloris viridis TaxID=1079 RepID=A0A0H5BPR5_BLAVI|nr:ABC transporter permease subunit [Blastochloris viridis]ALK10317.1 Putative 2-aminoethylphosphonate transport system permease protein PhnV [Blastochloris viridis]BAR99748.1 thiamin ABC transporter [Blastochloris viridis]CUU42979.1 spermidine/putrescine ABC transporter membrane protein [Blastochloris viridis]